MQTMQKFQRQFFFVLKILTKKINIQKQNIK